MFAGDRGPFGAEPGPDLNKHRKSAFPGALAGPGPLPLSR